MSESPSDTIEEYLQHHYREEKWELKRVHQILEQVWTVFVKSHTDNGWAYELSEGHIADRPGNYSQSTNAMILFAVGLGIGWIRQGALAVIIPQRSELSSFNDRENIFIAGLNQLIAKAKPVPPMFASASFGEDDPLTLSWVLDLLANSKHFESHIDATLLSGFRERVVSAAMATVDRAFRKPDASCLRWSTNDKTALDLVRVP